MVTPIFTFIFENMTSHKTKLGNLLSEYEITQTQLYYLIIEKTGKTIGLDRISKMVNGKLTNYSIDTAKTIAKTLGVSVEKIID